MALAHQGHQGVVGRQGQLDGALQGLYMVARHICRLGALLRAFLPLQGPDQCSSAGRCQQKNSGKGAEGLRVEGGAAEDTTRFLNPLCRPSVGGRAPGAREKHVTTLTCGGHGHVTRGFHTPGQGSGFPPRLEIPVEPVLTEGDVVHERPAHSDAFVHIA